MGIEPVFDDFHKFLVSIGLIAIVISVSILISQGIKSSDINLSNITNTLPGGVGFILIIIGIIIWYKKQKIIDISNNIKFINEIEKETSDQEKKKSLLEEKENFVNDGLHVLTKDDKYKRK
ncbi:hypothetical protein HYU10_01810 [Candidatus Woesearchaeota archaeon]|nr:hypothetical protein [Candidatus Woesearchaeota archaeon]MBI2130481.1 hypothetical protein [Candidatus Woesearchaeota archaeon]